MPRRVPRVPYTDLRAQYRALKQELLPAVERVFESAAFALGPEVEAFEKEFAAYCEVEHAVGVSSGTSALHLALLAAGIGRGDEVITAAMTFPATVASIGYTGARAVLVDIDPRSYTLDPVKLEGAISDRTKAIVPVHLYGQAADMNPILDVARAHGVIVIEDAAQAHGGRYRGRSLGSLGELGCFSFYPGKNLGAFGEAGMIVTSNAEYARRLRMLRHWGTEGTAEHVLKGYNYRMDGVQGAVLRIKLRHLEAWTELRRARAARYDARLAGSDVVTPSAMEYGRHVYHVYAVCVRDRDAVRQDLAERGIETRVHYPAPVHLYQAYADLGYERGRFPVSERLAAEELSLPISAELTEAQADLVAETLLECVPSS